ncbi:unnamed protein product, partial [Mesorhabditis spiculigera]
MNPSSTNNPRALLVLFVGLVISVSATSDVFSCFLLFTNHYLQKSGTMTIGNLSTVDACLDRCLQADNLKLLKCRSVMWRRDTGDCVLSRHSKDDRPASFRVAPKLEVDFYENLCTNGKVRVVRRVLDDENPSETAEFATDKEFGRTTMRVRDSEFAVDDKTGLVTQPFTSGTAQLTKQTRATADPVFTTPAHNVFGKRRRAKVFSFALTTPSAPTTRAFVEEPVSRSTPSPRSPIPSPSASPLGDVNANMQPIHPIVVTSPLNRTALVNNIWSSSADRAPTNFFAKQDQFYRAPKVRGSVLLVPDSQAPPTRAPVFFEAIVPAMRPIRPGPVTRHYYRPENRAAPTPVPATSLESEHMVDSDPLVSQRTAAVVSPDFRATINPIPTRAPTLTGRELADAPCFLKFSRRALAGFEQKTTNATQLRDCLISCLYSTDFFCASVNFDATRKICIQSGGSATLANVTLLPSRNMDYYENVCPPPPAQAAEKTPLSLKVLSRCMTPIVHTMLAELDASIVSNVDSLEECQSECLRARWRRARVCSAINWVPATRGCMLFAPMYDRQLLTYSPHATFFMNLCTDENFDAPPGHTHDDYYEDFAQ